MFDSQPNEMIHHHQSGTTTISVGESNNIGTGSTSTSPPTGGCILVNELIYYPRSSQPQQSTPQQQPILIPTHHIPSSPNNNQETIVVGLRYGSGPNEPIMPPSPQSNASSSPSSCSLNSSLANKFNSFPCLVNENSNPTGGETPRPSGSGTGAGKYGPTKKSAKKKSAQLTSELDEERTSQLVSEILKNIKEKTKELESMNQNLKGGATQSAPLSNSSSASSSSSSSSLCLSSTTHHQISAAKPFSAFQFEDTSKHSPNSLQDDCVHEHGISKPKASTSSSSPQRRPIKTSMVEIPLGWTRVVENATGVVYTSPSGVNLRSYQEVRAYLLCENTCKCGLQCPLNIYTTFNFTPSFVASPKSISLIRPTSRCACQSYVNSYPIMVERVDVKSRVGGKKSRKTVKVLDELNQNSGKINKSAHKRPNSSPGKNPKKNKIETGIKHHEERGESNYDGFMIDREHERNRNEDSLIRDFDFSAIEKHSPQVEMIHDKLSQDNQSIVESSNDYKDSTNNLSFSQDYSDLSGHVVSNTSGLHTSGDTGSLGHLP